jgi:GT2 family glycosyltransferase
VVIITKNKKMISVCIPTYNRLPLLKRCLDSFSQGFGNYDYEIIIADGGSTDGTLEFLSELENIKLIKMEKLTGATKAFNACFKAAKGEYIIIGSDDIIYIPEVCVKACKLMDKNKQIGMVSPKVMLEEGRLPSLSIIVKQYWTLLVLTFIIRKSVLEEMGYFDERYYSYFIDTDTSISVLYLGYTVVITREIGMYHKHPVSSRINEAYQKNRKLREEDMMSGYKKWDDLGIKMRKYLKNRYWKKKRALFFTRCCSIMNDFKLLQPFIKKHYKFAMKIYDYLLENTIIFKDKNYDNLDDFFLAQKFPDELTKKKKNEMIKWN